MIQHVLAPDVVRDGQTAPGADPSGLVDSAPAIQAALAKYGSIVLAPGRYLLNSALTLSSGQRLLGMGEGVTTLVPVGNTGIAKFAGSNVETGGYTVDNTSRSAGIDYVVDTGVGASLTGILVHNVTALQSFQAFGDLGTGTYVQWRFKDVKHLQHRGPGFVMRRGFAFLYLDPSNTLEFINSPSPNFTAFDFDGSGLGGAAGGLFLGLNVGGTCGTAGTTTAQKAFVIQHGAEIHLVGPRADTLGGDGLLVNACNNVYFDNGPFFGLCGGMQVRLLDTLYVEGGGFTTRGRATVSGAAAQHGVSFEGGTSDVSLARVSTIENTGDGVNFNGSGSNIQIDMISSRANTGNGVQKQGGGGGTIEIGNIKSVSNGSFGVKTDTAGVFGVKGGLLNANNGAGTGKDLSLGSSLHVLRSVTTSSGACADYTGPVVA